jgi:hypothetical protein
MTMSFTVLITASFNFIISILSVLSTLLGITVYFSSHTLRQGHQNLLFLSLLINSLILTVKSMISYGIIATSGNSDNLNGWKCLLDAFINLFCSGLETHTLMCIAIERYFVIKKQKTLNFYQILAMIVVGWVECALLAG